MPDIKVLADLAAEKIREGYKAPHAANSVMKNLDLYPEERVLLFRQILSELNRRSRLRREKNKQKKRENKQRAEQEKKTKLEREASRMAHERGDHLLPDP